MCKVQILHLSFFSVLVLVLSQSSLAPTEDVFLHLYNLYALWWGCCLFLENLKYIGKCREEVNINSSLAGDPWNTIICRWKVTIQGH